jgi:hypothetical protein
MEVDEMLRISAAVVTSVLAALLVVGVAWAGGDGGSDVPAVEVTSTTGDDATSTSARSGATSVSADASSSASATIDDGDGRTSTTVDDDGSTSTTSDDDGSTSTTLDDDGATSTTIDDDSVGIADQVLDFEVSGAATVTIQVAAGRLVLLGIDLNAGWHQEIKKLEADEIEIRFEKGDSRAELKVELDDGRVEWEVDAR